uniref:Protein kinase domain-containing protein n=1 Tax=Acrobeloides nanus TaxID=290746 RepID=A0A914EJC1_9BILA
MDKIRITHIESGTIHIKLDKYNFIISGSSTKWTDIFNDMEAKPDFWLADIIPEDAISEPSNLMDIHWFSSQSGGFHMKAFAPENVHLLATDEKADLDIYGKVVEIWNVGNSGFYF